MTTIYEFPYYDDIYNDFDRIQRFERLIKYSLKTSKICSKTYHRTNVYIPAIYYLYKMKGYYYLQYEKDDYHNVYMISDMFNDKCKVICKMGKHESPYEYYNKNREQIMEELRKANIQITPINVRDYIYEKAVTCSNHNPAIIMKFIKMYNAKKVIDMSGGWGDRLLGSMAAGIDEYFCTDPNTCVIDSYKKMMNLLLPLSPNPNGTYLTINSGFEKIKVNEDYYDLAYTSPPYFDLEIYTNEKTQSIEIFNKEYIWLNNFLKPCILKLLKSIKYGGHCVLYIGQQKGKKYMEIFIEWIKYIDNIYYEGCVFYGTYPKIHPIYIYKKSLDIPEKLYNPPLKVKNININVNVNIITDNCLIGGTITRGMLEYIKNILEDNTIEMLIIDLSKDEYLHMAVSYCLYLLKKRNIILVIISDNISNNISQIVTFYHKNTKCIHSNQSIGYNKKYYKIEVSNNKYIECLKKAIKNNLHILSKKIKRLWLIITGDFGFILLSILKEYLEDVQFMIVKNKYVMDKKNELLNMTVYNDDHNKEAVYDNNMINMTIIKYINIYGADGDYIWNIDGIHTYM